MKVILLVGAMAVAGGLAGALTMRSTPAPTAQPSASGLALAARIEAAALRACGAPPPAADLRGAAAHRACIERTLNHALARLKAPVVAVM